MSRARFLPLVALLALGSSAGPDAATLEFSGPPGSAKPFLTATPSGGLLATWFEPRDSGRFALRISAGRDGRWSAPATVAVRGNFFVNWADFPSAVESQDGRWIVHWLEKTATKSYAYHVRLSGSADRGASWSEPVTPHSDRSPTEHGFVAMLPRPGGGADLVWLDGRQTAEGQAGSAAVRQAGSAAEGQRGSMALAVGSIDELGRIGADVIVDPKVCDCCQTALARTSAGLIAVYRDRSDAEIRDIAVLRQVNGRWTPPVPVAVDGWVYRACPVNGPAVAAEGSQVAVAWYTGADGAPRVKLARSSDAAASFSPPLRIDDGSPLGRSEVELLPDGSVLVLWLERAGERAEWRAKQVGRDGRIRTRWSLGQVAPTREAGFARAALLGKDVYVAWTEPGPQGGVRIHRLNRP